MIVLSWIKSLVLYPAQKSINHFLIWYVEIISDLKRYNLNIVTSNEDICNRNGVMTYGYEKFNFKKFKTMPLENDLKK